MKYTIVLDVYGKKFRFNNIEAESEQEAAVLARRQLTRNVELDSVRPTQDEGFRSSNAKGLSPEEMMDIIMGKKKW